MKKPLTLLAVALLCASCAPAANTTAAPADQPRQPTASAPVSLSAGSGPQAPGRHGPGHHRHHLGSGQQGRGRGRR